MAGEWAVYWDNGREACGTFAERYDTEEEAEEAAEATYKAFIAERIWHKNDGPGCEAIRVKPDPEENQ